MWTRFRQGLLLAFAFVAPVYMILYPPLHEEPRSREAARLWRSLIAGTLCWLLAGVVWSVRQA
jgi:hypothetical protein